jgi:hypothetical protein
MSVAGRNLIWINVEIAACIWIGCWVSFASEKGP